MYRYSIGMQVGSGRRLLEYRGEMCKKHSGSFLLVMKLYIAPEISGLSWQLTQDIFTIKVVLIITYTTYV